MRQSLTPAAEDIECSARSGIRLAGPADGESAGDDPAVGEGKSTAAATSLWPSLSAARRSSWLMRTAAPSHPFPFQAQQSRRVDDAFAEIAASTRRPCSSTRLCPGFTYGRQGRCANPSCCWLHSE